MAGTFVHKCGDSFDVVLTIPPTFANGYFVGYTVTSQIRQPGADGAKVADLTCTWVDALTTRALRLQCLNTSAWTPGPAVFDVQFKRTSDGYVMSTSTAQLALVPDVTREG